MPKILELTNKILKFLMVFSIGAMAILVFINVFMRYALQSGILMTEELGRYLFVWLTFLGIISASIRNTHIRVDSLYRRMPPKLQLAVSILSDCAMITCLIIFVIGSWTLTKMNWNNFLPVSEIPVGTLYFAGIPCGLLVSIILLYRMLNKFTGKHQGE